MHFSRAFRNAGRSTAALILLAALSAGSMPAALAAAPATTGKPIALEGELDVLVEDYADGHSRTRHFLKTAHGRIELKLTRKAPNLQSGTRVRVHGQLQGDVLALDATDSGSLQTLALVSPYTMGEQKVAVILVNFQDDASQPITPAAANTLVLGSINNHYQESSFGQTWFVGQTFGYYTIPVTKTVCDPYLLAAEADKKVAAAGVDLAAYNRKVYMFPKTACTWAGLGNVGGSDTKAWANGTFNLLIVGHELGHNYGLRHAHALDCDVSAFGNSCTSLPYGDAADMMGNLKAGHFSPFAKEQLGWLNDGVSPPILTASSSGRYIIEPYSSSSVGAKAVKIPRGTDASGRKTWYYVEYRQPTGADAVLTTGNLTSGVVVRTATEGDGDSSYQIDMSPGSSMYSNVEMADGALAVGQSHVDAAANVSFTLAWTAATGAAIDVMVGGGTAPAPTCTRAAPALTLSGPTSSVAAGSTVTYTLSLANKDSSACAATTFNLARSIPSGWTGTLAASSLSLSPGTSASTTLTVVSAATATAGSYGIGAGASSSVGSVHTANASATYSVASAPSGTLSETVGTDKTSYLRGQTVYMSALVRNNGVAVNGASVSFRITASNGSVTSVAATSGSDGYARATYRLGKGKGAIGGYALRADASSGGSTASASTGFSVN
jgi:hypothetical protein